MDVNNGAMSTHMYCISVVLYWPYSESYKTLLEPINQGFFVEQMRHIITSLLLLYELRIKLIKWIKGGRYFLPQTLRLSLHCKQAISNQIVHTCGVETIDVVCWIQSCLICRGQQLIVQFTLSQLPSKFNLIPELDSTADINKCQ